MSEPLAWSSLVTLAEVECGVTLAYASRMQRCVDRLIANGDLDGWMSGREARCIADPLRPNNIALVVAGLRCDWTIVWTVYRADDPSTWDPARLTAEMEHVVARRCGLDP